MPQNAAGLLDHEQAARAELAVIEKLCRAFGCNVGDRFELADKSLRTATRIPRVTGMQMKSFVVT